MKKIDLDFIGGALCCILILVIVWAVLWVAYP